LLFAKNNSKGEDGRSAGMPDQDGSGKVLSKLKFRTRKEDNKVRPEKWTVFLQMR